MKVLKWTLAGIGGLAAAALVAVAALGVGASQAEEPPGGRRMGAYGEALANQLGISPEELREDRQAALDKALDAAVASGRITSLQAQTIREHPVRGGIAVARQNGGHLRGALSDILGAAAETLGMSKDDLKTNLKDGKSLADVAAAANISIDQLKAGMTAEIESQLDAAVAAGIFTQEKADKVSAGLAERLDKIIQHKGGERMRSAN